MNALKKYLPYCVLVLHFVTLGVFSYYLIDTLQDVFNLDRTHYWPGIFVFGTSVLYACAAVVRHVRNH